MSLPHHAGNKPGLRRGGLMSFFRKQRASLAGIARPRIGPGAAFVVAVAGRLAGSSPSPLFEIEDCDSRRRSGRSRFRAAPLRGSITPAPRTPETQQLSWTRGGTVFFSQQTAPLGDVGRIAEAPGAAAAVALADQRAIGRIARGHRRTLDSRRRADRNWPAPAPVGAAISGRQQRERHHTRPEQAAHFHIQSLSTRFRSGAAFDRRQPVRR